MIGRFRRGWSAAAIVSVAVALAASGCSGDSEGSSGTDTITIGVPVPLTGDAASLGEDVKRGAEMAVDEINAAGGVLGGKQIKLVYEDDKGTPEGGVQAVQKLINIDKVAALAGGTSSSAVLAEDAITKGKVVYMVTGAQSGAIAEQGDPYIFMVNSTSDVEVRGFAQHLGSDLNVDKVVAVAEKTAFGDDQLKYIDKYFPPAGIQVVSKTSYGADTRDFAPILSKIKSSGVSTIYVGDSFPARAAVLLQQIQQVGGFDKVLLSPGIISQGLLDAAGKNLKGAFSADIYGSDIDTPANKEFAKKFTGLYHVDPQKVNLVGYEGVKVLAQAIDKAGTASDPEKLASALKSTSFDTPRGTLTFDKNGKSAQVPLFIQQVTDGAVTVVGKVQP